MIYNEDCIAGMKKLADKSVNLVIGDPPYNIAGKSKSFEHQRHENSVFTKINEDWDKLADMTRFNKDWIYESYRILADNGSILVWGTRHNLFDVGTILEQAGFDIKTIYTWYKTNAAPNFTGRAPTETTEFCIWAVKGKGWTYNLDYAKRINEGKNIRNVLTTSLTPPKEKTCGKHPSQKRLDGLTEHLVQLHSNENDIVVIPFAGSGTEIIACIGSNRNVIGYELEREYIDIINKRIKESRS